MLNVSKLYPVFSQETPSQYIARLRDNATDAELEALHAEALDANSALNQFCIEQAKLIGWTGPMSIVTDSVHTFIDAELNFRESYADGFDIDEVLGVTAKNRLLN